jgi:hypothetical protein
VSPVRLHDQDLRPDHRPAAVMGTAAGRGARAGRAGPGHTVGAHLRRFSARRAGRSAHCRRRQPAAGCDWSPCQRRDHAVRPVEGRDHHSDVPHWLLPGPRDGRVDRTRRLRPGARRFDDGRLQHGHDQDPPRLGPGCLRDDRADPGAPAGDSGPGQPVPHLPRHLRRGTAPPGAVPHVKSAPGNRPT